MSMDDLNFALILIEKKVVKGDFEGSKPESLIKCAEDTLGLVFPATYRKFLLSLGCGDINGIEFYGLIDNNFFNSGIPDVVWTTLHYRENQKLNKYLIIVADNGLGGCYAIDTSINNSDGDCPVIDWWSNDLPIQFVADDFGSFFLQCIK